MPNLSGSKQVFHGDTSVIDTSAKAKVLTRAEDADNNVYIYLGGVASTTIGSPVKFDESGSTALLAADAVGPVAVAMSANTSPSGYGWYQVYGKGSVLAGDAIAADKALFISGTTGYVADTDVAGDFIVGMNSLAAGAESATTLVWLNNPFVTNDAIN